jgi:hypothetical protein
MIDKLTGPALRGVQRGLDGIRHAANDIATQPVKSDRQPTDLARSLVALKQHEHQVEAGVKALKAADQAIGTLLDVKA